MNGSPVYRKTVSNVLKIFHVLKRARDEGREPLTVSEIARQTGLHKWTVSRTVDVWMSPFVESVVLEELEDVGLKVKLVKLIDQDITEEQILRGLKIRI